MRNIDGIEQGLVGKSTESCFVVSMFMRALPVASSTLINDIDKMLL